MEKDKEDDISTPDTSRSNSMNEDRPSPSPILRSNAEITQTDSSFPSRSKQLS
jgi:hypothetical protein